jgi:sRNA-binding carbon storage regulator CsrA
MGRSQFSDLVLQSLECLMSAAQTGRQVSLGISAPRSVAVHRKEIFDQIAPEPLVPAESPDPVSVKPAVSIVIRNRKRPRVRNETGE